MADKFFLPGADSHWATQTNPPYYDNWYDDTYINQATALPTDGDGVYMISGSGCPDDSPPVSFAPSSLTIYSASYTLPTGLSGCGPVNISGNGGFILPASCSCGNITTQAGKIEVGDGASCGDISAGQNDCIIGDGCTCGNVYAYGVVVVGSSTGDSDVGSISTDVASVTLLANCTATSISQGGSGGVILGDYCIVSGGITSNGGTTAGGSCQIPGGILNHSGSDINLGAGSTSGDLTNDSGSIAVGAGAVAGNCGAANGLSVADGGEIGSHQSSDPGFTVGNGCKIGTNLNGANGGTVQVGDNCIFKAGILDLTTGGNGITCGGGWLLGAGGAGGSINVTCAGAPSSGNVSLGAKSASQSEIFDSVNLAGNDVSVADGDYSIISSAGINAASSTLPNFTLLKSGTSITFPNARKVTAGAIAPGAGDVRKDTVFDYNQTGTLVAGAGTCVGFVG